jgi:hypothetical protein
MGWLHQILQTKELIKYLVNFRFLKSPKLTIDLLVVGKLKKKFQLGATKWCNNKYQQGFASLDDPTNIYVNNVLFEIWSQPLG